MNNIGHAGWVLLIVSTFVIPYATAYVSHHPSVFQGRLVQLLAAVGGIAADASQHGWDKVTWGAVEKAFLAWAVAAGSHATVTKEREAKLYRIGLKLGRHSPGLPVPHPSPGPARVAA